nr:hypothetical protein [Tanacetum cinerariifolium]
MTDNTALLQALQAIQQQLQQQSQQLQQQSQQQIKQNTKILEALNIREQPKHDNSHYGSSSDEEEEGEHADLTNQQRNVVGVDESNQFAHGKMKQVSTKKIEDNQRYNIFQTCCKINQDVFNVIVDGGSSENIISRDIVTRLKLTPKKSPKPYKIGWIKAIGEKNLTGATVFVALNACAGLREVSYGKLIHGFVKKCNKMDSDCQRHIFQTRCKINQDVFNVIVDGGSSENIISRDIVTCLKLTPKKHPKPYKIGLMKTIGEVRVTEQCEVLFAMGKYKDTVLFDIVDMDCHVLLGRPWKSDLNVVHKEKENSYTFSKGGRKFTLCPYSDEVQAIQPKKRRIRLCCARQGTRTRIYV